MNHKTDKKQRVAAKRHYKKKRKEKKHLRIKLNVSSMNNLRKLSRPKFVDQVLNYACDNGLDYNPCYDMYKELDPNYIVVPVNKELLDKFAALAKVYEMKTNRFLSVVVDKAAADLDW